MQTITQKLAKTRKSINNYIMRGGSLGAYHGQDLRGRYDELKDIAIERGEWEAYCQKNSACTTHDGFDLFA